MGLIYVFATAVALVVAIVAGIIYVVTGLLKMMRME